MPSPWRMYERFRALLVDRLLTRARTIDTHHLQERVCRCTTRRSFPDGAQESTSTRPVRNPYKGLRPFAEQDAGDFCGRDALVADLVSALTEGARIGRARWPLGKWQVQRGHGLGDPRVCGTVLLWVRRAGPRRRMVPAHHPSTPWTQPVGTSPGDADLLLVIDQFEELFTLTDETSRAASCTFSRHRPSPSRASGRLTLRADFYDRPLLDPEFGPVFTAGRRDAHAMSAGNGSARSSGRPTGRTSGSSPPDGRARGGSAAQPGSLPLLQYALTELFERSGGGADG